MKIKVPFILPTEDFKDSYRKELPVEMHIPDTMVANGNIEYSVAIPDYMFNKLANSEPQFKTEYDQNNRQVSGLFSDRTITYKFKKTQTSMLIKNLQDYIMSLTIKLNDMHSLETATMKKKIFISFKHSEPHTANNLNHAYTGKVIQQSFKYFVGYEVMTDKFSSSLDRKVQKKYVSKIRYETPNSSTRHLDTGFKEVDDLFLPLNDINQSVEAFKSQYSIIDWTEEREEFCKQIQEKFIKVNSDLDTFLHDIDDDKMDELMVSSAMKILGKI